MTVLSDQEFAQQIFEIAGEPVEQFESYVFNNIEGDCIEFFVSPENYFAERIDDYLTLYLDMNTEEITGFVIKNVKRIIEKLSPNKMAMEFVIDDGKVQLRSLFTAMFAGPDEPKREKLVRAYRKVVRLAEKMKIDEVELACI